MPIAPIDSSPKRRGKISEDNIRKVIDDCVQVPSIKTIVFTGGEPLLLGHVLFRSIAYAKDQGFTTRVVTSAYWAKTQDKAREMVEKLFQFGLDELNISYDEFHRLWVNDTMIHWVIDEITRRNRTCVVSVQVTRSRMLDETTLRTRLKVSELQAANPSVLVFGRRAAPIGRGRETISPEEIVPITEITECSSYGPDACDSALRQYSVFPDGSLHICCTEKDKELTVGNVFEEQLSELINKASVDLFFNYIATTGTIGLLRDCGVRKEWSISVTHVAFCEEIGLTDHA